MAKEYFWGAKLSEDQKTAKWDPEADLGDEDDDDDDAIEHFLFLKQAVLGVEAKDEKRNVIEIETTNFDGETVCQPLVSLKLGLNESACLDIGLQPPVTFKLAAGAGPVFLSGQHALDLQENDEDFKGFHDEEGLEGLEEEDDDVLEISPDFKKAKGKDKKPAAKIAKPSKKEEDEDDEEEEVKVSKGKKRPAPSSTGAAKKLPKQTLEDDDEFDDDEEDDLDWQMALGADDDEEEEDSDEDEEDMDEEDEDEEEDEEDEEEEEEEEEESSPEKPPKKGKGKVNGTVKKAEPQKAQVKPKEKKEKKKALSLDDMKIELMKSPSKPKKEDKFKNFVKSRYQLTDSKKVQELWGWFKSTQLK